MGIPVPVQPPFAAGVDEPVGPQRFQHVLPIGLFAA
jgi:hypothetical protein